MPNVYLVGFMAAGKTAVGAALARLLDRPFVDLDRAVEARLGLSVGEIFELRGESAFRDAETAELERIASRAGLVVAAGGGAFCSPFNREVMHRSGGVSVFLDPPWEVILGRMRASDPGRPKWIDEHHARELYLARVPLYRTASFRIGVDGGEAPEEVGERIAAALAGAPCVI
jgi:shikimate kinase